MDKVKRHWHKGILQHLKRQLREHLGPPTKALRAYYKEYRRIFKGPYQKISRQEVWQQALKSPYILMGDYHTHAPAQEEELTLLMQLVSQGKKPILFLEMFAWEDQEKLDAFLRGVLSWERFLKAIKYNQSWGFNWENILPILNFGKEKGLKIYGLNLKANASASKRDEHFAKVMRQVLEPLQFPPFFAIVGDLHCAPAHLPKLLEAWLPQPLFIIYQNSESIYLKEMEKGKVHLLEGVRLSPHQVCLFNSSPWVKLESYLLWLENSQNILNALDEGLDDRSAFLLEHLAKILDIEPFPADRLIFFLRDDPALFPYLLEIPHGYTLFARVEGTLSFYLPCQEMVYLSALSTNRLTTHLTQALLCQALGEWKHHLYEPGFFYRRVVGETMGVLAAKLYNPYFSLLSQDKVSPLASYDEEKPIWHKLAFLRRAYQKVVDLWESMAVNPTPYPSIKLHRWDLENYYRLSYLVSHWFAQQLYIALEEGKGELKVLVHQAIQGLKTEKSAWETLCQWRKFGV